ncbi:MAG: hypothetical protein AAFY25_05865 [Pseudomonadota bacterium]
MKKMVLAAAFLGVSSLSAAADYTVKGSFDCEAAVREDENEQFREYNKWWLLGYFTARNYELQQNVGNGIDDGNIYEMALNFCKSNPGNDWDDAAIHIYDLLD